jgi:hypothetical protein
MQLKPPLALSLTVLPDLLFCFRAATFADCFPSLGCRSFIGIEVVHGNVEAGPAHYLPMGYLSWHSATFLM